MLAFNQARKVEKEWLGRGEQRALGQHSAACLEQGSQRKPE